MEGELLGCIFAWMFTKLPTVTADLTRTSTVFVVLLGRPAFTPRVLGDSAVQWRGGESRVVSIKSIKTQRKTVKIHKHN